MSGFLDKAILAHTAWKGRLRKAIMDRATLDVSLICVDNKCDLGKWIYGEGQALKQLKEFENLRRLHKSFHECAGGVATEINAGQFSAATARLESGDFSVISRDVVQAIGKLNAVAPR